MEKELSKYLRENEHVQWQGAPADFPLMETGVKFQILRKWILTVAVTIGLLAVYISANEVRSLGFIGLTLLVAAAIMLSPLVEFRSTRQLKYWITDQRVILMTRDKTLYYMPLNEIDSYQVVSDMAAQDCLVLGGVLFSEIRKQLRWRACHPKIDLQAHENQDKAQGLVLYGLSNSSAAVALLEKGKLAHAA